eukprot:COSAG02_NODE_1310_length_13323_cov_17.158878_9_plen_170_part_00
MSASSGFERDASTISCGSISAAEAGAGEQDLMYDQLLIFDVMIIPLNTPMFVCAMPFVLLTGGRTADVLPQHQIMPFRHSRTLCENSAGVQYVLDIVRGKQRVLLCKRRRTAYYSNCVRTYFIMIRLTVVVFIAGGRIQRLRGTTWRRGTLIEPNAWPVREHCNGCESN